jgi:hypothetical protein
VPLAKFGKSLCPQFFCLFLNFFRILIALIIFYFFHSFNISLDVLLSLLDLSDHRRIRTDQSLVFFQSKKIILEIFKFVELQLKTLQKSHILTAGETLTVSVNNTRTGGTFGV